MERLLAEVRREYAEPSPDVEDRVRHAVLHRAAYSPAKKRPWRFAVPAAAGAAALAGVLAAGSLLPADSNDGAAPPSGTAPARGTDPGRQIPAIADNADLKTTMALAAAAVATEPATTIHPGQYVYTESRGVGLVTVVQGGQTFNLLAESRHEMWADPQKGMFAERIVTTEGLNRKPVTPRDAQRAAKAGYDLDAPARVQDSANDEKKKAMQPSEPADWKPSLIAPTPEFLAALPTEPKRLLSLLRQEAADRLTKTHTLDEVTFEVVTELLRTCGPVLPAGLRAALYNAVALIPGVTRVPGKVNFDGRKGIAVGYTGPKFREELILDPATLQPIGGRTVLPKAMDGIPAGTVIGFSAYRFAAVEKVGETR